MRTFSLVVLMASWFSWGYPFIMRAPHCQKRESVTTPGATWVGLTLEGLAILLAFVFRLGPDNPPGWGRVIGSLIFGPLAAVTAFASVRHLGRQFRVQAGLYNDHELVRTGPYSVVRHPIYASLLSLLLATLLMLTPWEWIAVSLALFVAGTEIRVRAEDRLLASRFGTRFDDYRARVSAYLPFVR